MHIQQTLGNTRKFVTDYYGNRLNTERLAVISAQRAMIDKYIGYLKRLPVRKRTILYEANFGRGMVDNPYAIFLAALDSDRYGKLEHYWAIDDPSAHPELESYRHMRNVHIVQYESKAYLKALATCQYLVNNSTFMPYFIKRDGQVYVNTWHGTPIKAMGYEMDGGIVGSSNIVRNYLSADYLLSANDVMTRMFLQSYKMQGIYPGSVVEEGYPRNDRTLGTSREDVVKRLVDFGVRIDPSKKVIMYAPTWRNAGSQNDKIDVTGNAAELLSFKRELEQRIDTETYQVVIKPHNYLYDMIKDDKSLEGLLIPSTIDTNELLAAVDVLVSDFSSIVFDYLVLDRPILFYVPDLDDYRSRRGITYDIDKLPGQCSKNIEELAGYLKDLDATWEAIRPVHQACKQSICPYDDGNVSSRIADIMFLRKSDYRKAEVSLEKKKLLLSGGAVLFNGLTRSLISLLRQIDYDRYDVTVYVRLQDNSPLAFLDEIPEQARVLTRVGAIGFTKREDALRATYDGFGKFNPVVNKTYPRKAFAREARRCFGCAHFDRAIDFNGYEQMLSEIIVASNADEKVLWLHNDILADMNREVNGVLPNYWHLNHVISMYPEFYKMVSCGKRVMEINRDNFATPQTYEKFDYAKNTIDKGRIDASLKEEPRTIDGVDYYVASDKGIGGLVLVELPHEDKVTFINVARLSTEKNHTALVRAFARLHAEYPNTELFIVGDGPIIDQVSALADDLHVGDAVAFTGNVPNPFIFMNRSDCFILPSLHEGQPLVTLEARTCGLPVITGDFSTVQDSLIDGGQLVIQCDEQSILEGMRAFMRGEVPTTDFDADAYNREAFAEFERAIQ